jgi:hypothetical protein
MRQAISVLGALLGLAMIVPAVSAQDTACYRGAQLSAGTQFAATNMNVARNGRCNYTSGMADLRLDTPPRNGRVEINGSGVTYTPNPNFSGSDSYVFSGSGRGGGGRGGSGASGRVSITVSVTVQ